MMWWRSELLLLLLPCGFPYAVQRLGHASPALSPVRVLLIRVPLGPRPWLHRFRHRATGFVRRLRRYYAGVRLLWIVHQRLRLLTSRHGPFAPRGPWPIQRSPGSRTRSVCTCQAQTTQGPPDARNSASTGFAFRQVNNVGTLIYNAFAAPWLAYTLPYRRLADPLAEARTDRGRCG